MVVPNLEKFEKLSDEELVILCREGDRDAEEALVSRYTKYVRSLARPYFLAGGDSEDLIQEGMIGVIKAISGFDPRRHAAFKTFAFTCIKNRLYSAIKNASGSKHSPLNNYIPFETIISDSESECCGEAALGASMSLDPVEQIIGHEAYSELSKALQGILSGFELEVLGLYLEGLQYAEISERVSKPQKSVDNAVQRIRRKFACYISGRGDIR